jgi:hypothetical protein
MSDYDRRTEIEARLAALRPGEWIEDGPITKGIAARRPNGVLTHVATVPGSASRAFILSAPADLRWCLDRIAALEAEVIRLGDALESEYARGYRAGMSDPDASALVAQVEAARAEAFAVAIRLCHESAERSDNSGIRRLLMGLAMQIQEATDAAESEAVRLLNDMELGAGVRALVASMDDYCGDFSIGTYGDGDVVLTITDDEGHPRTLADGLELDVAVADAAAKLAEGDS